VPPAVSPAAATGGCGSWRRATSGTRRNQASASACGVPGCRRSKVPRRRWIFASHLRSLCRSTRVWASARTWRPSFVWPRWSHTPASKMHQYGTFSAAPVAR
jgi:hypothetical protein